MTLHAEYPARIEVDIHCPAVTGNSPPPEVLVVGAGAAGLVCSLFAARSGRRVALLESTRDGGRKILISGGGRCNILPQKVEPERFVTGSSPNTLRNILRSWPLGEQITFFERELAMRLVLEKESGKWFPETNRARDVRDRLMERVREAGVHVLFEKKVTALQPPAEGRGAAAHAATRP